MANKRSGAGVSGKRGPVLEDEVLHPVSDASDLCSTFPHTDTYPCAYCRAHTSPNPYHHTITHDCTYPDTYPPDADSPSVD